MLRDKTHNEVPGRLHILQNVNLSYRKKATAKSREYVVVVIIVSRIIMWIRQYGKLR